MKYAIFLEHEPFEGVPSRPFQRTVPVNALNDDIALKEATDYVELLFDGVKHIRRVRAHVQREDGSVLKEIVLTRDRQP